MAIYVFNIGEGEQVSVESWKELQRWVERERAHWDWFVRGDGQTDKNGMANHVLSSWDNIVNGIQNDINSGAEIDAAEIHFRPLSNGTLLASDTPKGSAALDAYKVGGPVAGAFAYGFLARQLVVGNAGPSEDFLGMFLAIMPGFGSAVEWSDRLKNERNSFKSATRSLTERMTQEANERRTTINALVDRSADVALRIFKIRRQKWRASQAEWFSQANTAFGSISDSAATAIGNINSTEQGFREFMKLKAPVEYWTEKAADHLKREDAARGRLYWYFPVTIAILIVAFIGAAWFLIDHPDTKDSKAPIALYVVVSGGLLLASTMAFWIGRLLTKLYLSEHHLRNDAEERATMTTTYLALTTEGAAADADRQIILNALFRATPDGIVKDDGPSDATLQGILTKLLTR